MKRMLTAGACVALIGLLGCDREAGQKASPSKDAKGIEIEWPGGSVKIGPEGDVDVKAPGVDVQYEKGNKVGVKAPGVDLDIKKSGS